MADEIPRFLYMPKRILLLFGTRPEVIKLAPVVRALRERPAEFVTRICSTGQHREMVQQALDAFDLKLDIQLDAMSAARSLGTLTARLFEDVDRVLDAEMPDWVIVQGDTTSAMAGAMSAYYRRVKIAHVEAGLRTYNRSSPFPEEINRTVIGHIADLHFAPTAKAAENLWRAGVPKKCVHITGNTVVDSLVWATDKLTNVLPPEIDLDLPHLIEGRRLVLVTSHRRESFGGGLENICRALVGTVERYSDAVIVYPVHPNPIVHEAVYRLVGSYPRIKLVAPLSYFPLVWLMQRSYCILTDSGGIQEEAPSLGKPVLILRDTTERPEVVEAGCAKLVGTNTDRILAGVRELFENAGTYEKMASVRNPFGDGRAGQKIAALLSRVK